MKIRDREEEERMEIKDRKEMRENEDQRQRGDERVETLELCTKGKDAKEKGVLLQ